MPPIYKQDKQEYFTRVWRKKNKNKENCGLALYARNQENQWNIDNGFPKHMTREKRNFEFLTQEKNGSVILETMLLLELEEKELLY
jgi:hypothetical protein